MFPHFTRLATCVINSDIDSSVAKVGGEDSFDGLASFASVDGGSDLFEGEAAAFEDPSTETLKATDELKKMSREESKSQKKNPLMKTIERTLPHSAGLSQRWSCHDHASDPTLQRPFSLFPC